MIGRRNGGLPSQVDKRPFQRRRKPWHDATVPSMFRNEQAELIQYTPQDATGAGAPLLIVPPQINKFYLFDLAPGRSVVEYLLANGIQVFIVSWRNPTAEHRDWGLDTYVNALAEITDVVRAVADSE